MPRTCIVSFRALDRTPVRTATYEFEDVVAAVDDVELLVPRHSWRSDVSFRAVSKYLAGSRTATRADAGFRHPAVGDDHELLLVVLGFPREVLLFNSLGDWRRRSGKAVVVLRELWVDELDRRRGLVERLNQFDHVFVEYAHTVGPLRERLDVPVSFLAPSVDTERFCPLPHRPARSIYLTNIGRRSEHLHALLRAECDRRGELYNYTTVAPLQAWDAVEHRASLAAQLIRTCYSVVARAKFDEKAQQEAGFRYFEGAAAGAVLVGGTVANEQFGRLFDWPDAVVEAADDDVVEVLRCLDEQPERVAAIRRAGVAGSLRRLDSAHRWHDVLSAVGMAPLPTLAERTDRLARMADEYEATGP